MAANIEIFGLDGDISFCIYKITNKVSGKVYIGQTKSKARRRWQSHVAPSQRNKRGISGSLKKHGKHLFTFEVIDFAESQEQLNHKEKFWIKYFNSFSPSGYNLTRGGNENTEVSGDSKERRKLAHAEWVKNNPEKLHTFGNGSRGRKRSQYEIEMICKGLTGRPVSESTRAKISISQKGRKMPRERQVDMARRMMKGAILTTNTGLVFLSYLEASEFMQINKSAIHNCANGKTKTCAGLEWKIEWPRSQ